MSNQHGTAVPRCSKIDHWTVFSPRGFVLSLLSFFCLIEQRSLWNDGFRVERRAAKRTHVAPPKGTSEHCFGCQRVRQSFSFGEKKPKKPKNKPVLQLLLLIQRGEGRGGGSWGRGGGKWVPAIFSLKCNELPAIFPPHFLLLHSNGASWITAAASLSAMSVLFPVCQCIMKGSPPTLPTHLH